MKQSLPGTTSSAPPPRSLLASASLSEIEVCLILLDLRNPIDSLSESLSTFTWGRRRKRSCLDAPPPLIAEPSPHSTSLPKIDCEETEVGGKTHIKAEVDDVVAAGGGCGDRTTASPDTPLSFSPSDSEETKSSRLLKKTSRKRSREDLIVKLQELTQRKSLLSGEIENVKKYYHSLKTYNLQLKSIKQEVLNSYPRQYGASPLSQSAPSIEDPTARRYQRSFGPITAQFHGLGLVNHVGPLGIDLNIPAEEVESSRPLDITADKRARFAEARRRRRGLIKIKAMRSACGIKLPTTR